MPDDPKILHVYAQGAWHDEAHLVGTRAAFLALAQAIHTMLRRSDVIAEQVVPDMQVRDGEGFTLVLHLETETSIEAYYVPYTAEFAHDEGTPHEGHERSPQRLWPRRMP